MVSNAKGGTGKTLNAYNIARELNKSENVAFIDADIDSSNFSEIAGIGEKIEVTEDDEFKLYDYDGIQVFSMSLIADKQTGVSMTGDRYTQILSDAVFYSGIEDADYIIIDMPAGSSDIFRAVTHLFSEILIGGIIVVQPAAKNDSYRTVSLYNQNSIPIIGVIENMAEFKCPNCEESYKIFGDSHVDELENTYGVERLGSVPLSQEIRNNVNKNEPIIPEDIRSPIYNATEKIKKAEKTRESLLQKAKNRVSTIAKSKLEPIIAKLITRANKQIDLDGIQSKYSFDKEQVLDLIITNQEGTEVISRTHLILKDGAIKVISRDIETDKQVVTDFQTLARIIYGKKKQTDGNIIDYNPWTAYLQSDLKIYGHQSTPMVTRVFRTIFTDEELMNEIKETYGSVLKKFI